MVRIFVAAAKALDKHLALWNCNVIDKSLVKSKVQWNFNPPHASHHGGSWERLIRSVKSILLALTPKQAYTDETLLSLFVEVESILNSRPLTLVKFKEVIEKPLTPNDLLLLNFVDCSDLSFALSRLFMIGKVVSLG